MQQITIVDVVEVLEEIGVYTKKDDEDKDKIFFCAVFAKGSCDTDMEDTVDIETLTKSNKEVAYGDICISLISEDVIALRILLVAGMIESNSEKEYSKELLELQNEFLGCFYLWDEAMVYDYSLIIPGETELDLFAYFEHMIFDMLAVKQSVKDKFGDVEGDIFKKVTKIMKDKGRLDYDSKIKIKRTSFIGRGNSTIH